MVDRCCTPKALKEIFDIAKSISSTLDVDALLKRIDSAAENLLDCEASSIMLLDDDKEHLSFKAATGEKGGIIQKMKVKVGEGIAGTVAKEQKPLTVNDCANDSRFTGKTDKESGFITRSILCVPMFVDEELIGVMEAINKRADSGFSSEDLEILESLASLAAVSINNAKIAEDQRNFFVNMIEVLISAVESHDTKLSGLSWRVTQISTKLARLMGIEGREYKDIYYGALLHNIGLLNLRGDVTISEGVITARDKQPETTYPKVGSEMIRNINLLKGAVPIIRHHRENMDGTGYPDGLTGDDIPVGARIVAVAIAVEEMRMAGLPEEKVHQILKAGIETRFDPQVIGIYLKEFIVTEE